CVEIPYWIGFKRPEQQKIGMLLYCRPDSNRGACLRLLYHARFKSPYPPACAPSAGSGTERVVSVHVANYRAVPYLFKNPREWGDKLTGIAVLLLFEATVGERNGTIETSSALMC